MRQLTALVLISQITWGSGCASLAPAPSTPGFVPEDIQTAVAKTPIPSLVTSTVPLSEGHRRTPRKMATRLTRSDVAAAWEDVLQLPRNAQLCVDLKNGTDICGRLEMVQSGRLVLRTSDSTSTAVTRPEVGEIRRLTKTRRLQQADGYAQRAGEHVMLGAEVLGPYAGLTLFIFPFYVAGAALVGAIKGSPEWTPVYVAP